MAPPHAARFHRSVDAHYRRVFALAQAMLGDRGRAEEVTQDAYERLWRHLAEIGEGAELAWLLTTTRRRAIDVLRRAESSSEAVEAACDQDDPERLARQAERVARQAERVAALQGAMGKLGPRDRALIELADINELPRDEVAQRLSLTPLQLKVYLHRARRKLAALLGGTSP